MQIHIEMGSASFVKSGPVFTVQFIILIPGGLDWGLEKKD